MSHSRDKAFESTKKIGVIGFPIKHSKSPIIHNYFIRKYNLNARYIAKEISSHKDLDRFINTVKEESWIGFNITIPYKQEIIKYLDVIDQSVTIIQACNTVVNKNGKLYGYNTDAEGFYYPLRNKSFSNAIILGNGGASKAVLYQLAKIGMEDITLVARNHLKSDDFVASIERNFKLKIKKTSFKEVKEKSLEHNALIINTTSVGMEKSDEVFELTNFLNEMHFFYDLIYNPWETKMIKVSKGYGCEVINGAYMLAHQGALAFKLFFDKDAETEKMYTLIKEEAIID